MKRLGIILLLVMMLPACGRLGQIRETDPPSTQRTAADCDAIFPKGAWQFVHAIQFFPPDGSIQTLMGVVRLDSETGHIQFAMMTIEGLVLFAAEYDGAATHIQRAVAPLDKPGLAQGMVDDIRLIFFAPDPSHGEIGLAPEDERICRYALPDGGFEEIRPGVHGAWEIRRYSAYHRLQRSVAPLAYGHTPHAGIPAQVELKAFGLAGYRLVMRLVEATHIEHY